ncbi:MAG: hypothetical protein A3E82_05675 [Gammaproteobacteria bacterium RIFCSPHIGHO2_12_FULL_38_11]|nr:MAG: hypothetical protein A3E82_05675 [Gammaproteobacteria bacterium RIFCSPHIGHO2_12_FULL_38_11]
MRVNHQFSESELTRTLQTVIPSREVLRLFERFAKVKVNTQALAPLSEKFSETKVLVSDTGFDIVNEDDFVDCAAPEQHKYTKDSSQKLTENSLLMEALIQEFKTISDAEVELLLQNCEIAFITGNLGFKSAFDLITINDGEKPGAFAKRKLFSLPHPLFQNDFPLLTEDEKKIFNALTQWHETHHASNNTLDKLLAKTTYFYDEKNLRLIINHAAIDVTTLNNNQIGDLKKLIDNTTKKIISHLKLENTRLAVEQIIPTIEAGRAGQISSKLPGAKSVLDLLQVSTDSRHIVLTLSSEIYHQQKKTHCTNRTFDPRTTVYTTKNYISLEMQDFTNTHDCGRHIAAMSIVAQKILVENANKSGAEYTKEDFEPYRPFITNAKAYASATQLKNYFLSNTTISAQSPITKKEEIFEAAHLSTKKTAEANGISSEEDVGKEVSTAEIQAEHFSCSIQALIHSRSPFFGSDKFRQYPATETILMRCAPTPGARSVSC